MRELRTEVVSVRLTPDERARLNDLGGATEVVRRALRPPPMQVVPTTTSGIPSGCYRWISGLGPDTGAGVVWQDGTVGQGWPALASG